MREKDYCYKLQPKADHQKNHSEFSDGSGCFVVDKVLRNENYILPCIRFRKFISDTSLEDSYTFEKFQTDGDIVLPEDDLYSIAYQAESNLSLSDHPSIYRDPVTIECTDSRESVTQQSFDGKLHH